MSLVYQFIVEVVVILSVSPYNSVRFVLLQESSKLLKYRLLLLDVFPFVIM